MYQHSVFGSPLPIRLQVSGSGCTCTLRMSCASKNLIKSGNAPEKFSSPIISFGYFPIAEWIFCQANLPFMISDLSSGKSASSQLSPIFSPAGKSLPKTSRSFCPPQIRCLYIGLNFNGYTFTRHILTATSLAVQSNSTNFECK